MNPSHPFVKALEDYHGRLLPPEARVHYVETLDAYPPETLEPMVRRWKDSNAPSSKFPSLNQLRAVIDDCRVYTWQRRKAQENKQPLTQPTVSQDPEYQRACWELIRRAAHLTQEELADAFDEHHQQWPGHDWDGAARRLRAKTGQAQELIRWTA